ncbi:MAG: DUF2752 domain-containing protein, partial [Planctomycetes bacterium]|nr:DUF2752 domain-containing protein [Planctomycetota bacterium]
WPRQYAIPCPTCGMTTAFAYVVRGRMLSGFVAQPLGALLALATCLAAIHAIYMLVTGRSWRINFYRLQPRWLIIGVLLLFGAAWAYKILATRGQMG